ncbi:MAG: flagellar hook assembly protein FlgD [Gammaproteobacteria bacterium]|nr:flagellar hook assembly protein FlgD [Gammaproteobacteria bacterium]
MNDVNSIATSGLFAPPPAEKSRSELGQEDFLTLMITQFQNQDPFEPMDNGEFLGQLAQFSTVNGIESLNSSFSGLAGSIQDEQALQAANLVGHSVLAISDIAYLADGSDINAAVELDGSASNVQIDITNSAGELVRRLNLGEQPSGVSRFSWDGLDASGERVPSDHYQITARVQRGNNVESALTLVESDIESVTLGQFGGAMTLNLIGGEAMSLRQVYQII